MKHTFSNLPYASNSLEPYIDQLTMEIHHDKHHKAYFDNFVKAVAGTKEEDLDLKDIFQNISNLPSAVRNNAGGFYNHNFFWACMAKSGKKIPSGKLLEEINKTFGNYDELKNKMQATGLARFGSGFTWLIKSKSGKLEVISTANQNNPLMNDEPVQGKPLMAIDVWEHAYYLKYQNRRADYITAFWSVVDWLQAEEIFNKN